MVKSPIFNVSHLITVSLGHLAKMNIHFVTTGILPFSFMSKDVNKVPLSFRIFCAPGVSFGQVAPPPSTLTSGEGGRCDLGVGRFAPLLVTLRVTRGPQTCFVLGPLTSIRQPCSPRALNIHFNIQDLSYAQPTGILKISNGRGRPTARGPARH
jgi:hypothetical protein